MPVGLGSGLDDLTRRVRPLWPDSGTVRRGLGRGTDEYVVLPSLRHPRLLVPAGNPRVLDALARAGHGQRLTPMLHTVARLEGSGLLHRLPVPRILASTDDSTLLRALRELAPATTDFVVRLGRDRPGRAVVVQCVNADGVTVGFGKAATGRGIAVLDRELASLEEVNGTGIPLVHAPVPLGRAAADHAALIAFTPLLGGATEGPLLTSTLLKATRSVATWRGVDTMPLRDTPLMDRLARQVVAIEEPRSAEWLGRAVDRVLTRRGGITVPVGTWHGDWVRWNMVRTPSEVSVWDWEHYEHGVPLGFDHLHFLAQLARETMGTEPRHENTWLSVARRALTGWWEMRPQQAEATILAYLLTANLRYVHEREDVAPPGTIRRRGWGRELVEHLMEEQA